MSSAVADLLSSVNASRRPVLPTLPRTYLDAGAGVGVPDGGGVGTVACGRPRGSTSALLLPDAQPLSSSSNTLNLESLTQQREHLSQDTLVRVSVSAFTSVSVCVLCLCLSPLTGVSVCPRRRIIQSHLAYCRPYKSRSFRFRVCTPLSGVPVTYFHLAFSLPFHNPFRAWITILHVNANRAF